MPCHVTPIGTGTVTGLAGCQPVPSPHGTPLITASAALPRWGRFGLGRGQNCDQVCRLRIIAFERRRAECHMIKMCSAALAITTSRPNRDSNGLASKDWLTRPTKTVITVLGAHTSLSGLQKPHSDEKAISSSAAWMTTPTMAMNRRSGHSTNQPARLNSQSLLCPQDRGWLSSKVSQTLRDGDLRTVATSICA